MIKKNYNLFILVTFCFIVDLKIASANNEDETIVEFSSETSPSFPPLLSTDASSPLQHTDRFSTSLVYLDTAPPSKEDIQSDSWRLENNSIIVQKCCEPNQALQLGVPGQKSQCQDVDEKFVIEVFWANNTHYWKYANSTEDNVSIVTRDPCTESKFQLDPSEEDDRFHLLQNASLYIPSWMDVLNTSQYCVDVILKGETLFTTAIICTSYPKSSGFNYFFASALLISTTCLIILAIYSKWRVDIDEDHKQCLLFFSVSMATAFFFQAISIISHSIFTNPVSILFAYILFYFKFNYHLWLNILCYDTYRCVKIARNDCINRESFMRKYYLIAFLVPLAFILINLIDKGRPALPNLYSEYYFSSSFVWCLCLFYLPILISVCINIYICSSIVVPKGDCKTLSGLLEYLKNPSLAPENISKLRNMYRRTYIICGLVFLFLILDIVIFLLPSKGKQQVQFVTRNVVYSLQGFFISCVFIRKDCFRRQKTVEEETNATELQPMTNNSEIA